MATLCRNVVRPGAGRVAIPTTAARCISLQTGVNDPELIADSIAPYPYGSAKWYKQSDRGLYGGAKKMYGNNTSEEYQTRKRRSWEPSVVTKRLYSEALQQSVHLRVTTRVLRTIDKVGGLDNYLLGHKTARVKELGETGWWLKWAILQTPHIRERFKVEGSSKLQKLGLTEQEAQEGLLTLIKREKSKQDNKDAGVISSEAPNSQPMSPAAHSDETQRLVTEKSEATEEIVAGLGNLSTDSHSNASPSTSIEEPSIQTNRKHRAVPQAGSRPFEKGVDLRFRVDNDVYLKLNKSGWRVGQPRAALLKRQIRAHSPVNVIKEWEPIEREAVERLTKLRETAPEQAAIEIAQFEAERAAYFQNHRTIVKQLTAELRRTGKVV